MVEAPPPPIPPAMEVGRSVPILTEGVTEGLKTDAEEMDATEAALLNRRELLVALEAMDRPPPPPVVAARPLLY